ncbi:formate C-acetyltransferase [Desulfocicer vacuolatum DSM 3385]|uniref:Formate C-acetyltransferase n=1 Tax=Desulfocicer vacuolatum DSM 3385 TaxID=1121400 RepID=A0A1W2AUP9_9BACT|nr:pyruvate formate lyase family protein [Desulfocicer vacuolatum]SMC63918.1 formate C-acetyltransferase [Desulfocicer vacuolatum DSM 3385]
MGTENQTASYMDRINKLRDRVINATPTMDIENALILTKSFKKTEALPREMRKAQAFKDVCAEKTVTIWDNELIVGCSGKMARGGVLCADVCWSVLDKELDTISNRPYDPFYISEEDKKLFREEIKPYWLGRSNFEKWEAQAPQDIVDLKENAVIYIDRKAVRGPGELTPDYEELLSEGMDGIIAYIEQKKSEYDLSKPNHYPKIAYLNAMITAAEGMKILGERYRQEALRLAALETDDTRRGELEAVAQVFSRIPARPARTFHEAIQFVYLYHSSIFMEQNAASYNLGRIDQYLYPYYKADLEAGRITPEQAQELFCCTWVKLAEPCLFQDGVTAEYANGYTMFQNVCAGGIDKFGQDAVNDLSYMVIQASMDTMLYQPSLSVRYNLAKNPDSFLRKCADCINTGNGFPAFHNDEIGIRMMQNKGVPLHEAYDWNPCGCVETNLSGRIRGYVSADVNLGSIVEFIMNRGVHRKSGKKLGLDTGDPRSFTTYQEFADAAKKQIDYIIKKVVEANNVLDEVWDDRPVPFISLTFRNCIDTATDYAHGGTKYECGNGIIYDGIADFINSIAAVKELVFDKKMVTMDELIQALDADFVGFEAIQKKCLDAEKYGNDLDNPDRVAAEMMTHIAVNTNKQDSKYGKLMSGVLPVTAHVPLGKVVGALPSGRKAWTTLTDGLSPTGGTDVNGASAVLKSVAKIPHDLFSSGTLLNMKLSNELMKDERGPVNLMSLLKSACSLGVFHAQFNVVDKKVLMDAQKHPEQHKDLLIRVAGYTAYFVELCPEVQDEIIHRTVQEEFVPAKAGGCC